MLNDIRTQFKKFLDDQTVSTDAIEQTRTSIETLALDVHRHRSEDEVVRTNISDTKAAVEILVGDAAIRRSAEDLDAEHEAFAWLSPLDPDKNQIIAQNLRTPLTGEWFLRGKDFQAWLEGQRNLLWLHGIPGAGKTVLFSSAIKALKEERARLAASNPFRMGYVYCDFKDQLTCQPVHVLGAIIRQLCDLSIDGVVLRDQTHTLVQSLHRNSTDKTTGKVRNPVYGELEELIKNVLKSSHHNSYIAVDALDECNLESRKIIILTLQKLAEDFENVHVLISSRREQDIRVILDDSLQVAIQNEEVSIDVGFFVERVLAGDSKLNRQTPEVKNKILSTLVEGSRGM